ncbi:hypothetical protein ACMXYV_06615 [Neptuniibacter sp. SY11_33]|uniref:hypothetical protein n=1 Tax=Neptuniibacter sp. SY11_33 TaxID=3398215 RepID=UPI0039F56FB9
MKPRTLTVMTMLLDLKAAAFSLLEDKHKNPALLNMYSLIDICASLSNRGKKQNRDIFESFLKDFAVLTKWDRYTTQELWAARSSLLHSYSPFGHHTNKENSTVRPIFYYSWPESKDEVQSVLEDKGYSNFILLDVEEIKWLALDVFNAMHLKVEEDEEFEALFLENSKNMLPSLHHLRFEDELNLIQRLVENA